MEEGSSRATGDPGAVPAVLPGSSLVWAWCFRSVSSVSPFVSEGIGPEYLEKFVLSPSKLQNDGDDYPWLPLSF